MNLEKARFTAKFVPWMLHNVSDYRYRNEKISRLVGTEDISPYLSEYFGLTELHERMDAFYGPGVRLPRVLGGGFKFIVGPALYTLCRVLRPKILVETGVSSGASSGVILSALDKNGEGNLYSIDLPSSAYRIPGWGTHHFEMDNESVGRIVPPHLKKKWKLLLGDARKILKPLLEDLVEIDIFLHDSKHTYEHMMFEFVNAWPTVKKGGVLLADDINLNAAFKYFSSRVDGVETKFHTWGAIKKL